MVYLTSHVQQSKRKYPGEIQVTDLFAYLESLRLTPREFIRFLGFLVPLMEWASAPSRPRWDRNVQEAFDELRDEILGEIGAEQKLTFRGGRVLAQPVSLRGKACFAVAQLLSEGNLGRIRLCRHCKKLFYGRFKHQAFCTKTCQEADYHTPEWRKKNRERNKRHQREWRERLFGKRRS